MLSRVRVFAFALAAASAAALAVAGSRASLADEPAPPSASEQARIKTLVENLGSDDFRVREAATKELTAFGEKARSAPEAARNSDVPEARCRADQILRRLDGTAREKPLPGARPKDDGQAWPRPDVWGGQGFGMGGADREDIERWVKEMQKRAEEFRGQYGDILRRWQAMPGITVLGSQRHFTAEGVDLWVLPTGAKLSLTEKGPQDTTVTHVYEGKDVDTILAAYPELKDKKGVADVLEQRKKAEEEAKERAQNGPRLFSPFTFRSNAQGVQIESEPGRVQVTVTENGPDGKPVTKTYEGTDLETLKKEHPELADKIGGFTLRFEGGTTWPGMDGTERRFRFDEPGAEAPQTGPFGLGLQRREGKGVLVVAVRPDSEAAKLGLKVNDVILSIDGTAVTLEDGPSSARSLIQAAKGGPMTVEILRDGEPLTLKR